MKSISEKNIIFNKFPHKSIYKVLYIGLLFITIHLFVGRAEAAFTNNQIHSWPLNNHDRTNLRSAFNNAGYGSSILKGYTPKDPSIAKMLKWKGYVRGVPGTGFGEITDFIRRNPYWPMQAELRIAAENAIGDYVKSIDIIKWFSITPVIEGKTLRFKKPLTAKGKLKLADAMIETQKIFVHDKAILFSLIKESWIENNFDAAGEQRFLEKYFKVITEKDYERRIDRLLTDRRITDAKRVLRYVNQNYKRVFDARVALIRDEGSVDVKVAAVPSTFQNDPGLLYERMVWRDRKGFESGVYEFLKRIPNDVLYPEKWWTIRKKYILKFFDQHKYVDAYYLAKYHGFKTDRFKIAEAEWWAGWISLRFLKNKRQSFQHFKRIYDVSSSPVSIARATYWMGRALEESGSGREALKWYAESARFPATFYGQLALLKTGKRDVSLPATDRVAKSDYARYRNNELAKLGYYLLEVGDNQNGRMFMKAAGEAAQTAGERVLVAQMGLARGRFDYSLEVAKEIYRAHQTVVINALFPVFGITNIAGNRIVNPPPEFVLSIIRQESVFDPEANSPAGAKGLMQLMPATAAEVARKMKIQHSQSRLISDPRYNVTLGAYYLAERVRSFNGSYMLAIASYNAGEGNVRKWMKRNGDPRTFSNLEDVVDWVEKIPFPETNNYVQRVLENLQMYRIGVSEQRFSQVQIDKDLMR